MATDAGRNIVVAAATVPEAYESLEWTIGNMYKDGDTIHIVHCFRELPVLAAPPPATFVSVPTEKEQSSWREIKSRVLQDFLVEAKKIRNDVTLQPHLIEDDPRDGLPRVCKEVGAIALVVGSRGQGALKRTFLGSTSSDLAHNSTTPVVIVHAKAGDKNIVLAADGDPHSQAALRWCLEHLYREGDTLHLVHCYEPLPMYIGPHYAYLPQVPTEKEEAEWRQHRAKVLDEFSDEAKRIDETVNIKLHLVAGDPRDELIRVSRELNAVALVVGCRGRGAVKRTFLGSTSSYLAHHSTAPLAIVRAQGKM
jgi:nucleotide-binding universal stress UspA family protein